MRNRAGAIALIAAPIIGLAATLALPNMDGDGAMRLAAIEAESSRFLIGNLLLLASFAVFVPAVFALRAPLLARGSRWGAVAAGAAGVGWTLHLAIVGMVMTQLPMAFAADRAGAAGLSDGLFESDGFTAVLLPMLLLTELGMILVAIALWRARLAPVWASALVVAALVAEFIVPAPFDGVALYALLTIGFVGIGWRMLRPTDLAGTTEHAPTASVDA
jgi:hypothetical protein